MKLLIDLDGTLLDARRRLYTLFCNLSPSVELSIDGYWVAKRKGQSHADLLRKSMGSTAQQIRDFQRRWMEMIELPEYLAMDTPYPRAVDALRALHQHGASLHVVTARQHKERAEQQVSDAGFSPYIESVFVTEQHLSKEALLRKRGVALSATDALVGDTGKDIEAARALGVRAESVVCGFLDRETLSGYAPDAMHADFAAFAAAMLPSAPAL